MEAPKLIKSKELKITEPNPHMEEQPGMHQVKSVKRTQLPIFRRPADYRGKTAALEQENDQAPELQTTQQSS